MNPTPGQVAQWAREAGGLVSSKHCAAGETFVLIADELHRLVTRAMAEQAEADHAERQRLVERKRQLEFSLEELRGDRRAGFDRVFEALGDDPDNPYDRKWSTIVLEIESLKEAAAIRANAPKVTT